MTSYWKSEAIKHRLMTVILYLTWHEDRLENSWTHNVWEMYTMAWTLMIKSGHTQHICSYHKDMVTDIMKTMKTWHDWNDKWGTYWDQNISKTNDALLQIGTSGHIEQGQQIMEWLQGRGGTCTQVQTEYSIMMIEGHGDRNTTNVNIKTPVQERGPQSIWCPLQQERKKYTDSHTWCDDRQSHLKW